MKNVSITLLLLHVWNQTFTLALHATPNRRSVLTSAFQTAAAATFVTAPIQAGAVQIYNTPNGIKYAVTKDLPKNAKANYPQQGDIVALDYTGYKTDGSIFDATHAEGKSNALLFKLGSGSVIPGLEEMVSQMAVGQKVQAIIPAALAYGDKGVCLENGECLIKSGETLVYDVYLIKASVPPP